MVCSEETVRLKICKMTCVQLKTYVWNPVARRQVSKAEKFPHFRLCKWRASGSRSICPLDPRPKCTCSRQIQQFAVREFVALCCHPKANRNAKSNLSLNICRISKFRKKRIRHGPARSSIVRSSVIIYFSWRKWKCSSFEMSSVLTGLGHVADSICIWHIHSNVNQNRNRQICDWDVEFIFRSRHGSASATVFAWITPKNAVLYFACTIGDAVPLWGRHQLQHNDASRESMNDKMYTNCKWARCSARSRVAFVILLRHHFNSGFDDIK